MKKNNIYKQVTNKIIEKIESGEFTNWQAEFKYALPTRSNGEYYKGINMLMLSMFGGDRKYSVWLTFNQINKLGGQVRKGEKAQQVIKFGFFDAKDKDNPDITSKKAYIKGYYVFNVDQCHNIPESYLKKINIDYGTISDDALDSFFNSIDAKIETKQCNPCYSALGDVVYMPPIKQFKDQASYYATLIHELVHWTGKSSRCNRKQANSKFSKEYAFEELVAELGACFLSKKLNIDNNLDNSAAYLKSWLNGLRNDSKFIFKAASEAQKACDYLLKRGKIETLELANG